MLREGIERIFREYGHVTKHPLKDHPFAQLVTKELPQILVNCLTDPGRYKCVGSVGKGNWARCPWISIFDIQITESAQSGYYPVYLFREDMKGVYLSLNQGVTDIRGRYKENPKEVLKRYAADFRGQLGEIPGQFNQLEIDLNTQSEAELASFYESGNVFARYYEAERLPSEGILIRDLREMVRMYARLVDNDKKSGEEDSFPLGKGIEDLRTFRQHMRYERNQRLAREVKKIHGYVCQACGFNFSKFYGELGIQFIEAHHLKSLSKLKGEVVELDAKKDFAVLCSNCHEMIHRTKDPSNLDSLKNLILLEKVKRG